MDSKTRNRLLHAQNEYQITYRLYIVDLTDKMILTGNKGVQKKFYRYSGFPGGLKELDYVKELLYPYGIPIYVHRNVKDKEKDFGVTPDRIEESVYQM